MPLEEGEATGRGQTPRPALENRIPWFEKHFQRFYSASDTVPGVRPQRRFHPCCCLPGPKPCHSRQSRLGQVRGSWKGRGGGDTPGPEHGVREDLLEKFLLRQRLGRGTLASDDLGSHPSPAASWLCDFEQVTLPLWASVSLSMTWEAKSARLTELGSALVFAVMLEAGLPRLTVPIVAHQTRG